MKIINYEDKIEFIAENDYELQALKRLSGNVRISWSKAWDSSDKTGNMQIHLEKEWKS